MDPVRPSYPQPLPTGAQAGGADAARLAAQKAFFDMAMGRSQAAATPAPTAAVAPAAAAPAPRPVTQVPRLPDPGAEPPQRILRPGSLLDIRV